MKIDFFRRIENWVRIGYPKELRLVPQKEWNRRGFIKIFSIVVFVLEIMDGFMVARNAEGPFFLLILFFWGLLSLPVHEIIHALAIRILKKPVERIVFYPDRIRSFFTVTKPGAYVLPAPAVYSKKEKIFVFAAPAVLLSLFAWTMAWVFPAFFWTWTACALWGFAEGVFDIVNILDFLRVPKGAMYFCGFWFLPDKDRPIRFEYLTVNDEKTRFIQRAFAYHRGTLEELSDPPISEFVQAAREDFEKQYGKLE